MRAEDHKVFSGRNMQLSRKVTDYEGFASSHGYQTSKQNMKRLWIGFCLWKGRIIFETFLLFVYNCVKKNMIFFIFNLQNSWFSIFKLCVHTFSTFPLEKLGFSRIPQVVLLLTPGGLRRVLKTYLLENITISMSFKTLNFRNFQCQQVVIFKL